MLMNSETLLLTTSDNHVVVLNLDFVNLAEKQRKIMIYSRFFENLTYNDFQNRFNNYANFSQTGHTSEDEIFSKGDVVTADCSTGTIYVNGQQRDDLGDIDNNWEDFCIRPGDTDSVSAACSNWVKENPEYIVRFQEAYL